MMPEQWILSGLNLWILIVLVVSLTGIAFMLCMCPIRKSGGSFFRRYAFCIFAELLIAAGIVSLVIGIVKAWPMVI